MRLIVETNFVLEIALLQAEIQDCYQILNAAEEGRIHLVVPAYALAEPNETLVRRHKQRENLSRGLIQELNQLTRSEPYTEERAGIDAVYALLLRSAQEERKKLEGTISRLIAASQIVPLDGSILLFSQELQKKHDISPQDSLILASVLAFFETADIQESCFVTKNIKDFSDPDILGQLEEFNCKVLYQFAAAAQYCRLGGGR